MSAVNRYLTCACDCTPSADMAEKKCYGTTVYSAAMNNRTSP